MEKSFAVISDIHGNIWALEAVLKDISKRNIKQVYNLGDTLYGPLDPKNTANIIMDLNYFTVQGNEDRIIHEAYFSETKNDTLAYVLEQLSNTEIDWLKNLLRVQDLSGDIIMFHGTPACDETYLLEDVSSGFPKLRTDTEIVELLKKSEHPLILCAHSHQPNLVKLSDDRTIVNPGSVGISAYTDDNPVFHCMETGSPFATYAIVSNVDNDWNVEFIKLSYNWKQAARLARKNKREDWGHWLETGRC